MRPTILIVGCFLALTGCGLSDSTLVDRGNSDGFAVGCDGRAHLTYGYTDKLYKQAYSEGYSAGRIDPTCKAWRRKHN